MKTFVCSLACLVGVTATAQQPSPVPAQPPPVAAATPDAVQKSLEELKAKAEKGDAEARCRLGECYEMGKGVAQNKAEAVKWYRMAAEHGDATAQFNLGVCYDFGNGVPKNAAEAAKWYRKSAEQGNKWGQTRLAVYYKYGLGVPQDHVKAHKWYNLAAAQGVKTAKESLSEIEQRMTREQIAEAQRLAREFTSSPTVRVASTSATKSMQPTDPTPRSAAQLEAAKNFAYSGMPLGTPLATFRQKFPAAKLDDKKSDTKLQHEVYDVAGSESVAHVSLEFFEGKLFEAFFHYDANQAAQAGGAEEILKSITKQYGPPDADSEGTNTGKKNILASFHWEFPDERFMLFLKHPDGVVSVTFLNLESSARLRKLREKKRTGDTSSGAAIEFALRVPLPCSLFSFW